MKIGQKKPEVNYNRKNITREVELDDWLEGGLKDVLKRAQKLLMQYGDEASIEYQWSGYESCECYVTYPTIESDDELENRVANEEYALEVWLERKEMLEEKERVKTRLKLEEFEKLKKELQEVGAL